MAYQSYTPLPPVSTPSPPYTPPPPIDYLVPIEPTSKPVSPSGNMNGIASIGDINQICVNNYLAQNATTGYLADPESMEAAIIALSISCGLLALVIALILTYHLSLRKKSVNQMKMEAVMVNGNGFENFANVGHPMPGHDMRGSEGSSRGGGRRRREELFGGPGGSIPSAYFPGGRRGEPYPGESADGGMSGSEDPDEEMRRHWLGIRRGERFPGSERSGGR